MANDPAVSAITPVEALLTGLAFAARDGRSRPLTEQECDEILAELRRLSSDRAVQPEEVLNCQWAIDDKGGDFVYETQCGHSFYFDDSSGAGENGFRCCPYCGLRLVEVKTSEATND